MGVQAGQKEGIELFAKPLDFIGDPRRNQTCSQWIRKPRDNKKGAWFRRLFFCPFLFS